MSGPSWSLLDVQECIDLSLLSWLLVPLQSSQDVDTAVPHASRCRCQIAQHLQRPQKQQSIVRMPPTTIAAMLYSRFQKRFLGQGSIWSRLRKEQGSTSAGALCRTKSRLTLLSSGRCRRVATRGRPNWSSRGDAVMIARESAARTGDLHAAFKG
jgi:hypothetical protein